jgi:S1-C subfamily serine protease
VNLAGQVVGINTLVATQAEPGVPAQGIGFAIAIATAKPIADQLVAQGKVEHAYLGVGYLALTPGLAAQLGITQRSGALIRQVVAGGPAALGGIQVGDVITRVGGTAIKGESALAQAVFEQQPGDTVDVTYIRNGQSLSTKVTLGTAPGG